VPVSTNSVFRRQLELTVPAQRNRAHLGGIRDGKRLEHTPRNTAQNLGDQQVHHRLRRKEDGGKSSDERQASHDRVPIPVLFADVSVNLESDNLANHNAVGQAGLPWGGDFPGAVGKLLAILSLELRKAEEVGEEADIVAFHDDAGTDEDGPSNGFGVEFYALPQAHGMLLVGREACIVDDFVRSSLVVIVSGIKRAVQWLNVLLFGHVDRVQRNSGYSAGRWWNLATGTC